jgi:hypothetical protein
MNFLNKLLLLSLSMSPVIIVSAQAENSMSPVITVSAQAENNDFDTFQTIDKYLEDFDYLSRPSYRHSLANLVENRIDYNGGAFRFYVFPIFYELEFNVSITPVREYYRNVDYCFFVAPYSNIEKPVGIEVLNYVGTETEMPFLAIDTIGMSQVIEHDKVEKSNSISIYNSFYNFFTGFFPEYVVNEYHGIFTFIVVSFLLFLVFGFVFFLFRVIRRLVGFK